MEVAIALPDAARSVSFVNEHQAIFRAAAGIGLYAGAFGLTFGAVATAAGLSVIQAVVMSAVMFTGASQFALVGILGAGGAPLAALSAALLLGLRNTFYGVPIARLVRPRGLRRASTAHFVIDETTAMAMAQPTVRAGRRAFWATGITLFALWNLGTLGGALIGSGINTSAFGLDAAAPAIFLALLWPQLAREHGRAVALGAVIVTLSLVTAVPAGVPIIAAAAVAIFAGLLPSAASRRPEDE
ncbi:MAG TPA: AzlC family ABC transporter permease [Solirubrobacteraceae bacterium]|nr:AzlC family ABC transporter permease [Solirubrobacteraceae bacterium]